MATESSRSRRHWRPIVRRRRLSRRCRITQNLEPDAWDTLAETLSTDQARPLRDINARVRHFATLYTTQLRTAAELHPQAHLERLSEIWQQWREARRQRRARFTASLRRWFDATYAICRSWRSDPEVTS